jgi:hypothetical protein
MEANGLEEAQAACGVQRKLVGERTAVYRKVGDAYDLPVKQELGKSAQTRRVAEKSYKCRLNILRQVGAIQAGSPRIAAALARIHAHLEDDRVESAVKRKGLWVGGTLPLGYHMKDDQIAVVEDEAERVGLIYRRYLELGPSCGRDNRLQRCCYAHFFKRD